jgi:GDP-4-dehydro-6-deoxy-D-mannose reductase
VNRLLITGFSGFVSRHYLEYLDSQQAEIEVLGVGRNAPAFSFAHFKHARCSFRRLDLLDKDGVEQLVDDYRPTHVLHLASYSSVGFSWQNPVESFANNTNIFLTLLEQIRKLALPCRILSVGSSEEYGDADPARLPLSEDCPLRPLSPYAVARVAQEMLSRVYVQGFGVDLVMTRSFNHIGPHQRDVFVVPSIARQLTAIRYEGAEPRLRTGDRTVVRDFVDVRDVASAYHLLLVRGRAGEVYNVCSGRGTSIGDLIGMMQHSLGSEAVLETDPKLVRPNDNRIVVGSNAKLASELGWRPQISLEQSIEDILAWQRRR